MGERRMTSPVGGVDDPARTASARPSTALVTGGTGYLGSSLVRRLVRDGWRVHVIVRGGSKLDILGAVCDRITVHAHDGTTEGMISIVQSAKPEVVFHLASLFLAQHKPAEVTPLVSSNVLFVSQLAEAMMVNQCHRLVNTGTAWQHFENHDYSPVCLYAATKQAAEDILDYYTQATPLRVVTLKIFDSFGPDDPRPKLFFALRKAALAGTPLDFSPGDQRMNLVYVDDLMEAFCVAGRRLLSGEASGHERFGLASRQTVSLKELIGLVAKAAGRAIPINWGARPYRPREIMEPWTKYERLPGWEAKVSLEEGIKRIVETWK
jgi:nucleoside-diphosphate-sugar epimerase